MRREEIRAEEGRIGRILGSFREGGDKGRISRSTVGTAKKTEARRQGARRNKHPGLCLS